MSEQMRTDYEILKKHILAVVGTSLKPPKSPLKYPFIDPGSVYDGNLWDWDSYWALFGLMELESESESLPPSWIEHARGNVLNFLDHQLDDGYIPMLIETHKDEKIPYLNRQHLQGKIMNMHKPFLCRQALLVSSLFGDYGWLLPLVPKLEKYFDCYDRFYFHANTGLYVWVDDIMIGMDNDPASFGRTPGTTANIFLNSFMKKELEAMAEICEKNGLTEQGLKFRGKAASLVRAIQDECWDKRDRFFYSADIDVKTRSYDWFHEGLGVFWKSLPIRIQVWSGFLPLWAGIATPEQAECLKKHYWNENSFCSPAGIRSLSREEKMYDLRATNNPSNWLGPIWIVASYCVFRGFLDFGYMEEARDLAGKTLKLLADDLRATGTLHEYYSPETGEPVMNGGFMNWNILALNMFRELEGAR